MKHRMTEYCQPSINGRKVSEEEMLRWEVERSRASLALLRRKLGVAGLQKLLSEENDESDREHERWMENSNGEWTPGNMEIEVHGLKLQTFLGWFRERVQADDQETLGRACPEHYVVTPTGDGRMDVIETTGGWGVPTRFFVKLGEGAEASPSPADVDPSYPVLMAGRGWLRSGTENGRVLHQFIETENGFKGKLAIYFPAAVPPEMVEGHRWHLACEFTNWVNLCIESLSKNSAA